MGLANDDGSLDGCNATSDGRRGWLGGRRDGTDDRGRTLVNARQGEIWWAEAEGKRRAVLMVTRSEAIPVLNWIVVAPVTRTVRGIPTEIPLGETHGLGGPCAASFDNLQPIRTTFLTSRLGEVPFPRREICRTLAAMADC